MPYYEVEITCHRTVCVKAEHEGEAELAAEDLEWVHSDRTTSEVVGELDEIRDKDVIQDYVDEDGGYTEAK